jgi:hypothetical protein
MVVPLRCNMVSRVGVKKGVCVNAVALGNMEESPIMIQSEGSM